MRIWFNRGFSLAPIAKAMMAADTDLEVVTSVDKNRPVHAGAYDTWVEPTVDDEAYVAWVRNQIIENEIDLFIPTRHRKLLAGIALPCAVHLPADIATLELLDDKFAFADAIAGEPFHLETINIASSADLAAALAAFAALPDETSLCIKPRSGVNGHGFWRLTRESPLSHIINPDARTMQQDLFLAALRFEEAERPLAPFVLMEYLPGPEVSFDVLCHHGIILKYVARTKEAAYQRLQTYHPLEEQARKLVGRFGLHGVINAQFRKARDGSWRVLEINARPAGGSIYGEEFGTGLLADWGGLLSGRLTPDTISRPDLDCKIETISCITQMSEHQTR
ncbi:ATP-dependent carboxylate-amine ligase [Novosphingobium sp. AAP1]|uniref:ATP-grasp domain-containing protein n=1 Tax=unclassified Novosphingobium TaxID=2644732 RepID=UPI0003B785C8|nr:MULTISPECIES: ATP-grasp domain-containing protein [unclassified Novosphingobium]KPF53133.1 ATP-dependent carboxylate-amine ligase [Novosphingobium sp. AAP1]